MHVAKRSPLLNELITNAREYTFKKGAIVYDTADYSSVAMMQSGYVKRYKIKNDGSLGVQMIYGPQDMFSFTQLYDTLFGMSIYDGPETYHYRAMSDVHVFSISADKFKQVIADQPELYKELFVEVGNHLKYTISSSENMSLGTVYAKVAHQLLYFAREFGYESKSGIRIDVPLTHQDLADMLSTTRETITVAVTKLRTAGIVLEGRQFVIPDMNQLAVVAYS